MTKAPAAGRRQWIVEAARLLWLPLAALLLGGLLSLTPMHARWSDAVDDALLRATASASSFEQIAVIDFDDAALIELRPHLGPWPFSRDVHAALLGLLRDAGARLVVFDIVFGEPRAGDAAFAAALAERGDVVLGAAAMTDRLEEAAPPAVLDRLAVDAGMPAAGMAWPGLELPAARLRPPLQRPGSVGIITTPLDADGHLRRLPLLHRIDGRTFPSLPLAALLLEADAAAAPLQRSAGALRLGNREWPVDGLGRVRLPLPANAAAVPSVGAGTAVLAALGAADAAALAAMLHGRTVFVGSSAFLGDRVVTAQGQLTGVSVLAMTYDAMRNDELIGGARWFTELSLLALALLPGLLVVRRGRPDLLRDAPIALAALGLVVAAAVVLLLAQRQQLSPLPAATVIVFGFVLTALLQLRWTARANRILREQRLAADAANAAKSEFLAGVSHELRTPLHAVLGMADVLSQTPLDAEQKRYVEVFRNAGASLASLIDDLLDLSRIEAAQVTLDVATFSLRELLDSLQALMEPRARAKGLGFELHVGADVGDRLDGDARRLLQVLVNLVGNALKFTHEGGIAISIERQPQGLVHVQVRDTGIGIAQSKLRVIFEPFTQADGSVTRIYGGSGLGLSISRQLVGLMGGQIWVDSEPGVGSTFHFTAELPVSRQPAEAAAADRPAGAAAPPGAGVNILLVEDNEVNVIVVEAMLDGLGHRLDVASNGEAAVEMFRGGDYGLVLMDVHMPGINGYDATRAIRAIEDEQRRPRTAVLALSASAFESDRKASAAAGCDGHLAKPLSRRHLLDAILAHGRPAAGSANAVAASAPPLFDADAALRHAGGDEGRRRRNLEHARVFLAGWQPLFQAARTASNPLLQRALCIDLQRVAQGAGATALAAAAARVADALSAEPALPAEPAVAEMLQQLQRAVAALTLAGP